MGLNGTDSAGTVPRGRGTDGMDLREMWSRQNGSEQDGSRRG